MTKKILILCRRDDRPDFDTSESMVRGLSAHNQDRAEFYSTNLEDLRFYFDGQSLTVTDTINNKDLKFYDAVFVIGWFKTRKTEELALSAAQYMKFHGKKVLNSEVLSNRSRSKLSQLVHASLNNVSTTEFVAISDSAKLEEYFSGTNLQFPLIAKSASASRGRDNHLVNSFEEMKKVVESLPTKIMLIQRYVPNDGDFRVIVMGDEVKMVIGRKSTNDSHLNNTSTGGKAEILDTESLDSEMLSQCVKISKLLGREITGVDMIRDNQTGDFYMLEINNMPQLSTGSFVAEKAKVLSDFLCSWAD